MAVFGHFVVLLERNTSNFNNYCGGFSCIFDDQIVGSVPYIAIFTYSYKLAKTQRNLPCQCGKMYSAPLC